MAPSHPSIQSFYQRETPSSQPNSSSSGTKLPAASRHANPIKPGDGFTEEELADAMDPMNRKWNPTNEYEEMDIAALGRGPKAVMVVGRIVNFSEILGKTASQPKARGWHNLLVRDDTGVLQVRLYFSHKSYPFRIGQLVSIWTTFVSDAAAINHISTIPNVPLATSIFPGRDTSAHIMVHLKSDTGDSIRTPLGCQGTKPLPGLMTLKNFVEGGHEVDDCKILVCVKSVGPRKQIPHKKNDTTSDLVEIHITDDTFTTKLNLWNILTHTGKSWIPNTTILLLTSPIYKYDSRGNGLGSVSLTNSSMVDVNPRFRDADWLSSYMNNLRKRESVKWDFPKGVWDLDAVMNSGLRVVYRLSDIDEIIRHSPSTPKTGFTTLLLQNTSLSLLHSRNMLLCTEHCGHPLYSNSLSLPCKNCNTRTKLHLNAKAIGNLVDETGCISSGKVLWAEEALRDLFGREVGELVGLGGGGLRLLDERVRGLRFI